MTAENTANGTRPPKQWADGPLALLVEGNDAVRGALRSWLVVHFPYCRFLEAGTGPEAIALVGERSPQTAVVFLNPSLAGGLDIVRWLREALPSLRVVAVSPHDAPEYRAEAEAAGAYAFVPVHKLSTDLIPALDRCLRRQDDGETR